MLVLHFPLDSVKAMRITRAFVGACRASTNAGRTFGSSISSQAAYLNLGSQVCRGWPAVLLW